MPRYSYAKRVLFAAKEKSLSIDFSHAYADTRTHTNSVKLLVALLNIYLIQFVSDWYAQLP